MDADRRRTPVLRQREAGHSLLLSSAQFQPLPNTLYRNDGSGVFTDVSGASGIGAYRGNSLGVVITDYDDDCWPDMFVANDSVPNFLFRNTGELRFVEAALGAGVAVATDGQARAGMGVDAGDYDGDGRLDLVVTNLDFETHSLFRNLGDGLFAYATRESGIGFATLPFVGFGVAFLDADNDTQLDIAIANGHILDNAPLFRVGRDATRSASCCSATATRAPLHRDRPHAPGPASRSRRSSRGAGVPATSTTTAISICS